MGVIIRLANIGVSHRNHKRGPLGHLDRPAYLNEYLAIALAPLYIVALYRGDLLVYATCGAPVPVPLPNRLAPFIQTS